MAININQNALERGRQASIKLAQKRAENQVKKSLSNDTSIAIAQDTNKQNDVNFLQQALETGLDLFGNIGVGLGKAIEGVVDAGATIVGDIGGIFDSGFKKDTENFIKRDFTGEWVQNPLDNVTQDSVLNNNWVGQKVEQTAQAVGQLLPNVVLTITGLNALTMPTLIARASGNSVEEALNDGADLYRATAYGAVSGTIEALTEKISDKLFGKLNAVDRVSYDNGKKVVRKALLDTSKAGFGKTLQVLSGNGEAIEEMVSEIVNPWIKQIYKADSIGDALSNGFNESFSMEQLQNVLDAGLVGALSYYAFLPVDKFNRKIIPNYDNAVKLSEIQSQVIEYNDTASKLNQAVSEGKISITSEQYQQIINELNTLKTQIENNVSQIQFRGTENSKTKAQNQLANVLNTNVSLGGSIENGQVKVTNTNQLNAVNNNYNQEAYSINLQGQEDKLTFKPTANTVSQEVKDAMSLANKLSRATRVNFDVVVTDELEQGKNGAYVEKDGVMYISSQASKEQLKNILVTHEFTHALEGTEPYRKYAKYILKELNNNPKLLESLKIDTAKYGKTLGEYIDWIVKNYSKNNVDLDIQGALSETVAKFTSEYLFNNEKVINRLCETDLSLGKKILRWIQDRISSLTGTSREERVLKGFLRKAETLYKNAIKNAVAKGVTETIDNEDEVQYSVNDKLIGKTFPPYNESYSEANQIATRWAKQDNVESGSQKIISYHNHWYVVEKFDSMPSGYQIVKRIKNSEYDKYLQKIDSYKGEDYARSIDEGIVNYENSTRKQSIDSNKVTNRQPNNNIFEMAQNRSSRERSSRNGRKNSFESGRNQQKFSISDTDSQGNTLTEQQREFFNDSKVVDENGNLMVVYHGSKAENDFTEFDKQYIKKWNAFGDGFYFTEDYKKASFFGGVGNRVFKAYINISNPLYTNSKEQINKVLDKLGLKRNDVENFAKENNLAGSDLFLLRHYIDSRQYVDENTIVKSNMTDAIKELGFDGIISYGFDNNEYVVFESNQIKNTDNKTPTLDKDIRFSISDKDSDGNKLTDSQREYFKDSKVVDENGKLMVVYHGTRTPGFTKFNKNFNYFTDNEEVADTYTQIKGIYKGYINIKNPFVIDCKDSKWSKIPVDSKTKIMLEKYGSSTFYEGGKLRTSTSDITMAIIDGIDNGDLDYDGIIFKNIKDTGAYFKTSKQENVVANDYVVFDSNQFKNIDNQNPTENADIRYSITDDDVQNNNIDKTIDDMLSMLSDEDIIEMLQIEASEKKVIESVEITKSMTKNERREAYVKKLYESGKLDDIITKIVEKNPAMKEYFKNSKMNNKYNPLFPSKKDKYIVMFHGTPNKDFNVFDSNKIGYNGSAMGKGFYFTKVLEFAEDYTKDYFRTGGEKTGRVISALLNIEKPLSRTKHEISKLELRKFISSLDNTGNDIIKNTVGYGKFAVSSYNNVLNETVDKLFEMHYNDAEMIEEMYEESKMSFDKFHDKLTKQLGYDGIIAWNKAEGTQAVVFKSSQIKDIFNYKPTQDNDIRYSVNDDTMPTSLKEIETKYKDYTQYFFVKETKDIVSIDNLVIKPEKRNNGIGQNILTDIMKYADVNNKTITLTPTKEFGTYEQLKSWYKKNDFVENKGKNTDLRISDTMYRTPNVIQYSVIDDDKLVALHNLSEGKLRNAIELGGLAVPSIAITKVSQGHSNFGDITLVFKKNTINPANFKNKVFSADAYSKRFPKTINKFKKNIVDDLQARFKDSANLLGDDVRNIGTYLEKDNIDNIASILARKDYVKLQYLKDNGFDFEPVYTEYKLKDDEEFIVKKLLDKFPEEVKNRGMRDSRYLIDVVMPFVKQAEHDFWIDYADKIEKSDKPMGASIAKGYRALASEVNVSLGKVEELLTKAEEYLKLKGTEVLAERATEEKLDKLVQGKYKDITDYVLNILKQYDEGLYYRNDTDVFDYYGNRRDFGQLYNKATLESIVKYMSGAVRNTEGFDYGVGNLRSLLTKQYKTLEEIKQDKNKIISNDKMEVLKTQSQELFFNLCEKISPSDFEVGSYILTDIAKRPITSENINFVFKDYNKKAPSNQLISEIKSFMNQLKDYPTEYFEAKPQRAVTFNEIARIIAPETLSADIKQFFKTLGIEIELYKDGDDNRQTLIQKLPDDVKFSVDDELFGDLEESEEDRQKRLEALKDFEIEEYDINNVEEVKDTSHLKGQTRDTDAIKFRAKLNQDKVYSKEELSEVVKNTIKEVPDMRVSAKVRDQAIDMLFERMNTQDLNERTESANTIADFIINNAYYENFQEDDSLNYLEKARSVYDEAKRQKIRLNEPLKKEVMYRFGSPQGNGVLLSWFHKDGVRIDHVAEQINEQLGYGIGDGINIDTSEQDIFMQMYDNYQNIKKGIKKYYTDRNSLAKDILKSEEVLRDKKLLVKDILKAYDEKGTKTPLSKLKSIYQNTIAKLKKDLKDTKLYSKAFVDFMVVNKQAKEVIKRGYSASHLKNDVVEGFLKEVAGAGNIKSVSKTARARMKALKEIYTLSGENSLFRAIQESQQEEYEIFGQQNNYFDMNLADMITEIADGEGELTAHELNLYTKITQGLLHLYQNFDKTFRNGKYEETTSLADKYTQQLKKDIETRNKVRTIKFLWKGKELFDPHAVFRNMDSYGVKYNKDLGINEDVGFFSEFYKDITDGEVKAKVAEIELLEPFGDFYKTHKGFEKRLTKETITLELDKPVSESATSLKFEKANVAIPLGEAISIYLTSLRSQSNFDKTTITLANKDKTQSTFKMTLEQVEKMFDNFDATTKEYIKLVQDFFNDKATKLKVETDLQMWGYTNIEDGGNYFPINREASTLAKKLGDASLATDAFNVYNASFNKSTRPGARQSLFIGNVYSIVEKHAWGISAYYGLYAPLRAFNQVYNKRIGIDNYQTSIRQMTKSDLVGATEYIDKLLKDIQGISSKTGFGKIFQTLRGNYAKYQLGLNPKTVLGQTSSYLMAQTYLDVSSLAKGLTMKANTEQMYKYAPFTKYRMVQKDVVKAQTNTLEKLNNGVIGQIGETLTSPIGWMDNNTVKKLWNACQVQVEKNAGYKIGSEENLNKAGELLERVVRETQSNSITSEKTGFARSQNELLSALTMFTSDAQKQISRLADGVGTNAVIRAKVKSGELSKDSMEVKVGKRLLAKSATGFVTATSMYVLIGILMKWLLGKRDEDKSLGEEFAGDFASQVAGLFPVIKDIYGYMIEGYDMNNYAYSMVTDLADGVKSMWGLAEKLVSGKQVTNAELYAPLRKAVYGTSQILGLPTRNLYNYTFGIISKFSPSTAYKMNSLFYNPKVGDLDKAIENNQTVKSETIMKELFKSKNLEISSSYARELVSLYKDGYNIIPSKIGDSFTYNETLFELSSTQQKKLIQVSKMALATNESIINSKLYASLSNSAKASYLKGNYNINYIMAVADIVGAENLKSGDMKKYLLAKAFNFNSKLIDYMAYVSSIEADVDKKGNVVEGSKKQKIQKFINSLKISSAEKYLLMAYAGYKNKYGEAQVKAYLKGKGFDKSETETIMNYCGY